MSAPALDTISTLLSGVILPRLKHEICADRRILVVDDEPITRSITKVLLEKFGFSEVVEVDDVATALVRLRETSYALVVSDYLMEPKSGLDLFREMRKDRTLRQVPFLMLTSSLSHDVVLNSKRAGVEHYLLKPFRLGALQEKLVEILAPHEHLT
jgi:two-component system chemotaxis response regulator CheY